MNKYALLTLTSTVLVSLGFAGSAEAVVFFPTTGNYYDFIAGSFSWMQAFDEAANKGGYLLTITSQEEQDFINDNFDPGSANENVPGLGWGWIGASAEGGAFTWRNGPELGTPVSFTNWASGEPNNPGVENYVHIDNRSSRDFGTWNNWFNESRIGYYIEYDKNPEAVSEPISALAVLAFGAVAAGGALKKKQSA
jgi:hypothetical protein